jgi:hypothetical protein
MARTYEPIQTLNGTGSSTLSFSTLPTTYTDLILVITNLTIASTGQGVLLRFNGVSGTVYGTRRISGSGSNPIYVADVNQTGAQIGYGAIGYNGEPGHIVAHINDYRNTTLYKTIIARGSDFNSEASMDMSNWQSTNAITDISVISGAAFNANTIFTLYGILAGSA